jgi:hypothetical protein
VTERVVSLVAKEAAPPSQPPPVPKTVDANINPAVANFLRIELNVADFMAFSPPEYHSILASQQ